jgi:uncharacterized membrane protein YcaP (DUF421 family)
MPTFLYDGWADVWRTILVGVVGYVYLLCLVRWMGKRTLSEFNVFDFIVSVALGSTLASAMLTRDVSLMEVVAAFAALVGMQFVFAMLTIRSGRLNRIINGEPSLVFHGGDFLRARMRHVRVTEEEVRAAIRDAGFGTVRDVAAVVLETNGTFSVIAMERMGGGTSLADVSGAAERDVGAKPEHTAGGAPGPEEARG